MSNYVGDIERWHDGDLGIGKKHWYSKFSPAALGRTLNKIRKSPILKAAIQYGDRLLQNPAVAKALGLPPEAIEGIHAGVGALWVEKAAKAGNVQAQAALQQAYAAVASPAFQGTFLVPQAGVTPSEYASGKLMDAMPGMMPTSPFGSPPAYSQTPMSDGTSLSMPAFNAASGAMCPCCGRPQ